MAKSTKPKNLVQRETSCANHCMLYIDRLPLASQEAVLGMLKRNVDENKGAAVAAPTEPVKSNSEQPLVATDGFAD